MRGRILKVVALLAVVCALSVAGYFVGKSVEVPEVVTWVEAEANANRDAPSDRMLERQIRALTERDPEATAGVDFHEEGACYYGVKTKDGWMVPGVPPVSLEITKGLWPVRMICWTGEAGKGALYDELDRVAVAYAVKYNQRIDLILCTN